MGNYLKPVLQQKLRTRLLIVTTASAGICLIAFLFFFGYFNTGIPVKAKATTLETIPTGSFLVNMGITPQTTGNGLVPYGMIYELINTYNVPVKWVIEPTKIKDGNDFTHNGVSYKGGTFIIRQEFISTTVAARIAYWQTQGVSGNYSVSEINVPVYSEITSYPKIMVDNLSGNDTIIAKYFLNAQIPASSYEINSPVNLNVCHDIWINPHGDPTWATHNYLYNFVTVQKSFIWMQCHAVSMMEYCTQPIAPFTQLNYLTTNGLKCYMASKCGTNPEVHAKNLPGAVNYYYPTDPVMQFMGGMSGVAGSGSEKWFVPISTGGWRTTTKRLATTGSAASPNEGVILVYGPAFGDINNGLVMYAGGHDMNDAGVTDKVAAQRSFFNFLLIAGKSKAPLLTNTINTNINANATDTFSVSATGGQAPYTFAWSSTAGGTFSAPNDSTTLYTAFHTMIPSKTVITCVITDACGRRNFVSIPMSVNASPLPISLMNFTGKYEENGNVLLAWKTASEINNNYFTITRSADGKNFSIWKNISSQGNSNSVKSYTATDVNPLTGVSYYRLSQTDYDGKTTEFNIVKLVNKIKRLPTPQISAGPNPFQNRITVNIPTEYKGETFIRIWNASGRMVVEKKYYAENGNSSISIEALDNLPKGTYILRVYNESIVSEAIKLIK